MDSPSINLWESLKAPLPFANKSQRCWDNTAWEVFKFGVFLVRILPYSDWMHTAQKWSFPLSISSVNVTGHTEETLAFCVVNNEIYRFILHIQSH